MLKRVGLATVTISALVVVRSVALTHAQTPVPVPVTTTSAGSTTPAAAVPKPESSGLLVRVDVVVIRLQGDKKISSLPYTVYATPGYNSSLRLGQQVPVVTALASAPNGNEVSKSVTYQSVGTNIDVNGFRVRSDGRYEMAIALSSSFVYAVPGSNTERTTDQPVIGSYTVNGPVIVRDGQTLSFSTATDKVTGETMRADLVVTAMK